MVPPVSPVLPPRVKAKTVSLARGEEEEKESLFSSSFFGARGVDSRSPSLVSPLDPTGETGKTGESQLHLSEQGSLEDYGWRYRHIAQHD